MFTDNHDSSFCFWVLEKRLTRKNCFLFCKRYGLFNSCFFLTINKLLLSYFPNFHGQRSGGRGDDKILVFHTRSRVVSASSGSRPGHKVSGTRLKFPNLNENGQKSHSFCEVFQTRNPVNILSRSAIVSHGEGSFKEPLHKQFYSK